MHADRRRLNETNPNETYVQPSQSCTPPHPHRLATSRSLSAIRRLASFYRDLLDLQIVRDAGNPLTGDAVLLSGDPLREDHELVLLSNPAVGFFLRDPEGNAVGIYLARSEPRHDRPCSAIARRSTA